MDQYELLCLFRHENEPEGTLPPKLSSVVETIQKYHGTIVSQEDWGVRRLAYEIQQQTTGHYLLFVLRLEHASIKPLTAALQINTALLRHQLVEYVKPAPRRVIPEATTTGTEPSPAVAQPIAPAAPSVRTPLNTEELDKTIEKMLEEKVL